MYDSYLNTRFKSPAVAFNIMWGPDKTVWSFRYLFFYDRRRHENVWNNRLILYEGILCAVVTVRNNQRV